MILPKRIKIKWSRCKLRILQEDSSHSNSHSLRHIHFSINHQCYCSFSIYLLEESLKCKSTAHNLNLDKLVLHYSNKCLWCHLLNCLICLWELHHQGWCHWDNLLKECSLWEWNQCHLLEDLFRHKPCLLKTYNPLNLSSSISSLQIYLLRVYHHSSFLNLFLGLYPCQLILTDRLKWLPMKKSDLNIQKKKKKTFECEF